MNQPTNPATCPECTAGKHGNCDGTAMDLDTDRLRPCSCALNVHGLIPPPARDVSGSARARGVRGAAVTDPQTSETPQTYPNPFNAMGWLQDYQDCLDGTNGDEWAQAAEKWLEDNVDDLPTDGSSWKQWRDYRLDAESSR